MPVNLVENLNTDNFMDRLSMIQDKLKQVETSYISDIPNIQVIGEVETHNNEFNVKSNSTSNSGVTIPIDILDSMNDEPKRVFSAMVLESNIRKIRLKRYSNEAEKLDKKVPTSKLNVVNETLSKVDSKNCEWNLLSKRAQRSAVIKYCNELKVFKGEMIKLDKKVLGELKSTLWEFIKSNPDFEIDYASDEEIITNIDFLELTSSSFKIVDKENNVLKKFTVDDSETSTSAPKKRKIKLSIKSKSIELLKKDD